MDIKPNIHKYLLIHFLFIFKRKTHLKRNVTWTEKTEIVGKQKRAFTLKFINVN